MKPERPYFLDNKGNVRFLIYIFHALCFVLFAADFVLHRHSYHPLEEIPAFYALFGFLAFSVIILGAAMLRKLVMRPEDYYEAPEEISND
ncbi:MAG: hypothetical protein KJ017_08080 [Alphaproteobacteria bacterium]|nr:hypothetical protein [Alphaproteobacteria bacterium]